MTLRAPVVVDFKVLAGASENQRIKARQGSFKAEGSGKDE